MPKVLSAADIESFRDRLCDIAEEKFAALGPDGVTLRDLASAMGVSPMTPYRYFKDKDAILAAVRVRAFSRFAQAMESAEASGARKKGVFTGAAYVDWALKNPAAYRLMFDTQQPTAEAYPDLIAAMARAQLLESRSGVRFTPRTRISARTMIVAPATRLVACRRPNVVLAMRRSSTVAEANHVTAAMGHIHRSR